MVNYLAFGARCATPRRWLMSWRNKWHFSIQFKQHHFWENHRHPATCRGAVAECSLHSQMSVPPTPDRILLHLGLYGIKKLAFARPFGEMLFRGVKVMFRLNIVFVHFESGRMLRVVISDQESNLWRGVRWLQRWGGWTRSSNGRKQSRCCRDSGRQAQLQLSMT